MAKTKKHPFLNEIELSVLHAYEGGKFSVFGTLKYPEQFTHEVNNCNDPFFIFLIREISTGNGCYTVDEAKHRLAMISKKIFEVSSSLYGRY